MVADAEETSTRSPGARLEGGVPPSLSGLVLSEAIRAGAETTSSVDPVRTGEEPMGGSCSSKRSRRDFLLPELDEDFTGDGLSEWAGGALLVLAPECELPPRLICLLLGGAMVFVYAILMATLRILPTQTWVSIVIYGLLYAIFQITPGVGLIWRTAIPLNRTEITGLY